MAGTEIINRAEIRFRDGESGLPVTVQTNAVRALVAEVEAVDLASDQRLRVNTGGTFRLPHRLANTGNARNSYRLQVENLLGDAFDIENLQVIHDLNGNGVYDSGEPVLSPSDSIALEAGEVAQLLVVGNVPVSVPAERVANVKLSAVSASGRVSDSNTDAIETIVGISLQVNKSVTPATAKAGDNLDYTVTVLSKGAAPPLPRTVSVDGVSTQNVVLFDKIPTNTQFVSWLDSPADSVRAYHLAGEADDVYVTAPPSDLARVDGIALLLKAYGAPNRLLQMRFRTSINQNASGIITNVAQLRYSDGTGDITVNATTDSNITTVPLPLLPPSITPYLSDKFDTPARIIAVGAPLWFEASVASCNQAADKVETATATIYSVRTGDVETVTLTETGPNTGIFRSTQPLPTRDVAQFPVERGNKILETTPRDTLRIVLNSCDTQNAEAKVLVSPFGVVFDSRTDTPIAGARVTLIDLEGVSNGGQRGGIAKMRDAAGNLVDAIVVTGSDGVMRFGQLPPGLYRLEVVPPAAYQFPSKVPPALLPPDREVDPSGSYGRDFYLSADGGTVAFDVPLDSDSKVSGLFLEKEASSSIVEIGGVVDYRVRLRNASSVGLRDIVITDRLPRGFAYIKGTARRRAGSGDKTEPIADPQGGSGPILTFKVGDLGVNEETSVIYRVRVGAGSLTGNAKNMAQAIGTSPFGPVPSNTGSATIQVVSGVLTDRVILFGKVFVDANKNHVQDGGEIGIPGVRLFLEDGTYAVTDGEGKYSIYGLSRRTHVVKLDTTTMPPGSRLVPLTNEHAGNGSSAFAATKVAEMHKVNFAIVDAKPSVLDDIQARRASAERAADDEFGLANSQLTSSVVEANQANRTPNGGQASGTISRPSGGGLTAPPTGTLATSKREEITKEDSSIFKNSTSAAASAVKTEGDVKVLDGAVPPKTEKATADKAPAEKATASTNTQTVVSTQDGQSAAQAQAADGGSLLSTHTLSGDSTITKPAQRDAENVPEGADRQPVKEPIGAGNSSLPTTPVQIAPSVNYKELLPTLTSELGFLELRDGDTLLTDQATIRVKGSMAGDLRLAVNGVDLKKQRLGAVSRLESKQLEVREYVGVPLRVGANELELSQLDGFGNVRGTAKITVVAPGNLGRLKISLPEKAAADGRTAVKVRVRIEDAQGTVVSARTSLTLESSLGSWQVIDLNPLEPGVQVFVDGGQAEFALLSPMEPGDATIRITSGIIGATARLSFLPELRPLIGAGIIEGQFSSFRVRDVKKGGNKLGGNFFDDELSGAGSDKTRGRGALYFKGRVQGKYLLTLRYDSQDDKENERLFRDIQPDEFYPVYGDSSLRGFDAQSTSKLYVRVDREKSYVLYGDFTTSGSGSGLSLSRSLGEYSRSLTGLKANYENDRLALSLFNARDNNRQVVEEIPARGTSGPYLLNYGPMVRQSEKIELVVRDRNQPSVILKVVPQTRFSDYTLDGLTDGILFRAAIPSRDENFNPIYIRVTYEVEQGGPDFSVRGLTGQYRVGEKLLLGGSWIDDRNPEDPLKLRSFNAIYQISPNTLAIAEFATTDRGAKGTGSARRFEFLHEGARLQARLFLGHADRDFDNPSSLINKGRDEAALRLTYALNNRSRLIAEALRSKDLETDNSRRAVQLAYERELNKSLRLELGVRSVKEDIANPTTPGGKKEDGADYTSLRARLTGQVPGIRKLSLFTEYERAINDGAKQVLTIGGQYQLNNRTRLYASHELFNSLDRRYALGQDSDYNATLVGIDTDYMKNGRFFSEYRLRDGIDGRSAQAAIGLRNLFTLGKGLRLGTSLERVKELSGNLDESGRIGTAASLALEYTPRDNFKVTGRVEGRVGGREDSFLGSFGLAYKPSASTTILARDIFTTARTKEKGLGENNRDQHRFQIGMAYRPVRNDRLNALAKYEFRSGQDTLRTFGSDLRRKVHILSGDVNYQPNRRLTLSTHLALRKSEYSGKDTKSFSTTAGLITGRVSRELNNRFQLDVFGGRLFDQEGGQWNFGTELGIVATRDLILGLGYNFSGFRDDELTRDTYTRKGAYLRLRWKFDENLFGGLRSETQLANAQPPSKDRKAAVLSTQAPLFPLPNLQQANEHPTAATSDAPRGLPTGNSAAALDAAPLAAANAEAAQEGELVQEEDSAGEGSQ